MPSVIYMPPFVVRDDAEDFGPNGASEGSLALLNATGLEHVPHPLGVSFYVTFFVNCCTFIIGIVGNSLLVLVYGRTSTLKTSTNTYILSIAITDLLVTVTCNFIEILTDLAGTWPFSDTACKISQAVMEFSSIATVLSLTAISVERYYAVVYPIEKHLSTRSFAMTVTFGIWTLAFFLAVPKYINAGVKTHKKEGLQGHAILSYCVINQDHTSFSKYMSLFDFIVFYTVPLIVVCVLYAAISRRLMRNTEEAATTTRMSAGQVNLARMRFKVAKMVIALSIIFFVGFLPHNVLIMRIFIVGMSDSYWNSAASFAYCYGCLHFWMNPIVLYLYCDTVRIKFNKYLFCGSCPWRKNRTETGLDNDITIKTHL